MFRSYQPHPITPINEDRANEADTEGHSNHTDSIATKKEVKLKESIKSKKNQQ